MRHRLHAPPEGHIRCYAKSCWRGMPLRERFVAAKNRMFHACSPGARIVAPGTPRRALLRPETKLDDKDVENVNEYIEHTISRGETLTSIARRYGTTVQELVALNGITNPDLIYAGTTIRVPATTGTRNYVIRRGDTLSGLAQQYGTTVNELVRLNGIADPNRIYAGDTIRIPNGSGTTYIVQRGDTLWAIARRYGTTVNRLARYNGITNPSRLSVGQVLLIP